MLNQEKIKTILKKINWLAQSFEDNQYENISALEKELLKEKVLMFYDEIENIPTTKKKESRTNIQAETVSEPVVIEKEKIVVEKNEVIEESRVEKSPEPIIEVKEPSEKFKQSEAFQKQISMPKRDMREIIDLNKSFILKAELFDEKNELYKEFIEQMNTTRNEEDAFKIIVNWTQKQNWETEENKAYDLLLRAVEKRFLPLI